MLTSAEVSTSDLEVILRLAIDHVEFIIGASLLSPSVANVFFGCMKGLMDNSQDSNVARDREVTAAEIWAGLISVKQGQIRSLSVEGSEDVGLAALESSSPDLVKDWAASLRFTSSNVDVRGELRWLTDILIERALPLPFSNAAPSLQYKRLCFLQASLVECAWSGAHTANTIASRISSSQGAAFLSSPYHQVRQEIARTHRTGTGAFQAVSRH